MTPAIANLIDAHVHVLSAQGIDRILAMPGECGLEALALMSLAQHGPEDADQNEILLRIKRRAPDTVYIFGAIEYHRPGRTPQDVDPLADARRLRAAGFDGMKMLEGKPTVRRSLGLALNDPRYDAYYAYLQNEAIPLLSHVGDPETFWDPAACPDWARAHGWFYDASFPTLAQLYAETEDVLARFPRLRVIFAHFLFLSGDIGRADDFLRRHPCAHLDITPGSEMYFNFSRDVPAWQDFFTRHADRILFGTDNTDRGSDAAPGDVSRVSERVQWMCRFLTATGEFPAFGGRIRGLGLDPAVVARICAGNFRRLVGARPRPLHR